MNKISETDENGNDISTATFTITETIENGNVLCTASSSLWVKGHILLWPPEGKEVDRSAHIHPGDDWIPHMCRVLRENIETYEEAVEAEKMYSKHRDSNSFREDQERKAFKRKHPVLHLDQLNSDLIDANDLLKKIDADSAKSRTESTSFKEETKFASQPSNYHGKCTNNLSVTSKAAKNTACKAERKTIAKPIEKRRTTALKKPLPFQKNHLKSRTNRQVDDGKEPKRPRYDNFLKSGKHSNELGDKIKVKCAIPSATITKAQHLKQMAGNAGTFEVSLISQQKIEFPSFLEVDIDDGDEIEAREFGDNYGHTSTPEEKRHKKDETLSEYDFETTSNHNVMLTGGKNGIFNFAKSGNSNARPDFTAVDIRKKVHVLQNIEIQPATISSHSGMSFEEKVLSALNDMKKVQETYEEKRILFETRIEKRIETLSNGQPRMQGQCREKSSFFNGQSQIPSTSRQFSVTRKRSRIQYQEPVHPVHNVDDFEDFEELDQSFPMVKVEYVEELEYNLRKNLELKFILNSRLIELGGNNYRKCIRLQMKYLFIDSVLERFTWRGTEDKDSFKQFKTLNRLIFGVVRFQFPECNYERYKDYMIQWIKHSRSRQRTVTYSYPKQRSRGEISQDEGDESDFNN